MSYERRPSDLEPSLAEWHKSRAREMFRTIERRTCRHQTMARHLGEEMAPCGQSCDACAGLDPVGAAPQVASKRMSFGVRAATAEAPSSGGSPMFTKLRALRKKLADARRVPAYMVFND